MSCVPPTEQPYVSQARNDTVAASTLLPLPSDHVSHGPRTVSAYTTWEGAETASVRGQRPSGPGGEGARTRTGQSATGVAAASGEEFSGDPDGDDVSAGSGGMQQEPDPLYDEAADEDDAAWAERQREGRRSDAVLSCPGCFTTLCIDCQRHEKYHHQYRAMFVMNCKVEEDEQGGGRGGGVGFNPAVGEGGDRGGGGGGGRRSKRARGSAQYRRVCCNVCGTEVGALEVEEELYHFYHIFPSNA
ncbi:hypothetical protein Vafri_10946 [Volvox africanus]|uniref:E2F-associated phosphoprotein n=1 Tax=Volvox africanus TaxID=51714 RepID=A0A8J4F0Y2_9CHLO|nr:hypothetical protein Vafri_10946 [Volvox africanus]